MNSLNREFFKLNLIIIPVVSFIFLFGIKFDYIQFRFFILILLFPCLIKIYNDIIKKDFLFFKFFSAIFLFITTHIGINLYFESAFISYYSLFGVIFFLSIFIIAYYYYNFLNRNLDIIIKTFLIIFLISSVYNIIFYKPDAPFFCGGLPDFLDILNYSDVYSLRLKDVRLSFSESLFEENSHLGMIAPSVIAYSIYQASIKKISFNYKFLIIFFIIICFIKSSTTLLLGIFLSFLSIILLNYKVLTKKVLIFYIFFVVSSLAILVTNKECVSRFVPIYGGFNLNENKINTDQNKTKEIVKYNVIGDVNESLVLKFSKFTKSVGSLSAGVYFHALTVAQKSILENPIGWGLNRYDQAFNYFIKKNPQKKNLNLYNNKDGTNNFVKIIVEFGFFGFLFYIFLFLFLKSKKIPIELKLFYLPFIITQSIRGIGYFNGGFALIVLLMIFSYINHRNKLK